MCTLHLFYRVFPGLPILFAANRDEILDRAWDCPAVLADAPRIFGPKDAVAGGTWLGVNEAGVLVGLANHEGTLRRAPSFCSRGAVVLDTLRHGSAEGAKCFAERAAPACKSYTLLIADRASAHVVERSPRGTFACALEPGCHVITNARFRDPRDRKARRSRRRMEEMVSRSTSPAPDEIFRFLADHERDDGASSPLCIHATPPSRFGTSSASVICIDESGRVQNFFFAPGPPCSTPFAELAPVFGNGARKPTALTRNPLA